MDLSQLWVVCTSCHNAALTRQIMKQGANSAVRFTSYATLQQAALDYMKPETGKLGSATTFGLGAIAGLITVCECRVDSTRLGADQQTQLCLWTTSRRGCRPLERRRATAIVWTVLSRCVQRSLFHVHPLSPDCQPRRCRTTMGRHDSSTRSAHGKSSYPPPSEFNPDTR